MPAVTDEQRETEVTFEAFDLMADGRWRLVQFGGGDAEVAVSGGSFKGSQGNQAGAITHYFYPVKLFHSAVK
ncbi:hypothetical protein [Pseudomonas sp. C1C7]|uniref:hypothetical protein n=1 Tax=Pseudomonas sp. C1C7 TaxID=2735272 RepID=UPI0021141264|nr:hypothetical protein [Pseudomonas sp. C1C7]